MSIEKTLKGLQDAWETVEAQEGGGFTKFEDNDYVVRLTGAKVGKSKNERTQVIWELVFGDGPYEDKTILKFDGLEDKTNLGWVKGIMSIIGMDIPKELSQLPAAFEEFFDEHKKGIPINISLVTKNEFQNIFINSLVEDEDEKGDKKEKREKPAEVDLDDMTFKQLKGYVKENDLNMIDVTDFDNTESLVKAIRKQEAKAAEKAGKKDSKKSRFDKD